MAQGKGFCLGIIFFGLISVLLFVARTYSRQRSSMPKELHIFVPQLGKGYRTVHCVYGCHTTSVKHKSRHHEISTASCRRYQTQNVNVSIHYCANHGFLGSPSIMKARICGNVSPRNYGSAPGLGRNSQNRPCGVMLPPPFKLDMEPCTTMLDISLNTLSKKDPSKFVILLAIILARRHKSNS